ncbi:MAG: class I SAM-dependent methyltransferase [Duodenibacillus sp.]
MTNNQNHRTDFGFKEVVEENKAEKVRHVFDSVARKYDMMNDVLSFGLHRGWKHVAVESAQCAAGDRILDIASGTCDLAIRFGRIVGIGGEVWATDINGSMLGEGRKRLAKTGTRACVAQCDCEALPFADNTFDVAIVSFGLRNMTHKDRALSEMTRVVRPGGRVMVLEFSHCDPWFRGLYDFYSFKIMPWLGGLLAGDAESYRYLAESIRRHPDQKTLASIMDSVGLENVRWRNMCFGVCALHLGVKPQTR